MPSKPAPTITEDGALVAAHDLHGVLPPRPRLAVVGARAAHVRFRELVPPILGVAAESGWSLVSGGALGIDGDAHRAARAAGLSQLAVLPCGADRPYPPAHRELFASIVADAGSGVLYMQPRGTEPTRAMFVSRNRHVVALADAVIVVEAERPSGTLHTGRLALRRGVPVAAVTGSRGAADLVGRGASSLPADPGGLAAELSRWLHGGARSEPTWPLHLLWVRDAIAAAGPEGLRLDGLADPVAGAVAITEAELWGLVVEAQPGRWRMIACG